MKDGDGEVGKRVAERHCNGQNANCQRPPSTTTQRNAKQSNTRDSDCYLF